jgi:hypothetical protein
MRLKKMVAIASLENKIGDSIYDKVERLYSELVSKKVLQNCSNLDKKRIDVIINEIKYDANRIKNKR